MLYIHDYRSIPSPDDGGNGIHAIRQQLNTLTGRMITVYTDNSSRGFSGVLTHVMTDSIKLVVPPVNQRGKVRRCGRPGTAAVISLSHITAIAYKNY